MATVDAREPFHGRWNVHTPWGHLYVALYRSHWGFVVHPPDDRIGRIVTIGKTQIDLINRRDAIIEKARAAFDALHPLVRRYARWELRRLVKRGAMPYIFSDIWILESPSLTINP